MIRKLLVVWLMLAGCVMAADGIMPNIENRIAVSVDGVRTKKDARAVFTVGADGKVTLTVRYVKADDVEQIQYSVVRLDGPVPTPVPPDPKPQPTPVPIPAELWGIVVEETKARTPEQAVVLASPMVRMLFKEFRCIDPWKTKPDGTVEDNPIPEDLKPYAARAKGQKLPQFYVADKAGTIYYEGLLPNTVAEVQKLVGSLKSKEAKR